MQYNSTRAKQVISKLGQAWVPTQTPGSRGRPSKHGYRGTGSGGSGKARRISAAALSLHWNQHDFSPISETLTSNPAPGEYSIDGRYAYNIFSDGRDIPQAFASDQIAGNIKGVLTVKQDSTYSFIGEAVI